MKPTLISKKITTDIFHKGNKESERYIKSAAILYPKIVIPMYDETVEEFVRDEVGKNLTPHKQKLALDTFSAIGEWHPNLRSFSMQDFLETMEELGKLNQTTVDAIELKNISDEILNSVRKMNMNIHHELISFYYSLKLNSALHAEESELENLSSIFYKKQSNLTDEANLNILIPDVDKLDWSDIFELRQNPYLERFRMYFNSLNTSNFSNQQIEHEINNKLWKIIGFSKPNQNGSIIKRIISNLSIPFLSINPYSAMKDIKEGLEESNLFFNYGWIWFIQEAKQKLNK